MTCVSLYIHIPFCKQKCLYCDFPSYSGKENIMTDYAEALAQDIEESLVKRRVNTIFIGGGTPTYLSLEAWKIISKAISKLDKSDDLEFTVECNPGTITHEKLELFKNIGVNRLSIGLQSWQDNLLKKIGRIHTLEDFKNSFKLSRNFEFNNINVDLMFALPEQTLNDWIETLNNVIKLKPEHISCYSLIIEEGTCFYQMYNNNKLKIPDEDVERKMYNYTLNFLRENGYFQYEISNFAKPGLECKHNLVYWDDKEYIGCGAAAHSYIDKMRYHRTKNVEKYIEQANTGNLIKEELHNNSLKDDIEEFMFMGLRKVEGVSMEDFYNRFGIDIYSVYNNIINKYRKQNLLIIKNERLFLSKRGMEVSNSIMCDFIMD
ncbi:oxygen-independent coproporphyrinogen III oxidase [Clostridium fermenticellae]|uniref:Heme chaperone HemW n=1 Tax=Clostridium fermenticellae TaxID=2068654 RepID=A0A386H5R2_9CLOT|nr:radical SAM family heme chaperone HemW [Clostridium fermenticellae]AYD40990.1 oxygen-independent coproporphyrinogen III oxidase [Clostridium fermenticellae]